MRFPQVVVFENDGRLAHVLTAITAERRWVLRESRQPEACLKTLSGVRPAVFVLRLPAECSQELSLLDRVVQKHSDIRSVAVLDAGDSNALAGLAWDLGADFVMAPPMSLILLPDIVAGLMPAKLENQLT